MEHLEIKIRKNFTTKARPGAHGKRLKTSVVRCFVQLFVAIRVSSFIGDTGSPLLLVFWSRISRRFVQTASRGFHVHQATESTEYTVTAKNVTGSTSAQLTFSTSESSIDETTGIDLAYAEFLDSVTDIADIGDEPDKKLNYGNWMVKPSVVTSLLEFLDLWRCAVLHPEFRVTEQGTSPDFWKKIFDSA